MAQYQGVWSLQSAAQLQSTQRWVTDPLFDYTTLLLQADAAVGITQNNTFIDSSSNVFAISRNGNTTQGTFSPFSLQPGAWSNFTSAASASVGFSNATAALVGSTASTFTAECWIFMTDTPVSGDGVPALIGMDATFNSSIYLGFGPNASQKLVLRWFDGASKTATGNTTLALNTWYHIAVVANSNALAMYVNGVPEVLTGTTTLTNRNATTNTFSLFLNSSASNYQFRGYASNIRVCTSAVYTSAFTPSTSPLTTTSQGATNCRLLTSQNNLFIDNSSNAYALTLQGTPSVQAFSPFAPQYQWTSSVIGGSGYFDGTGDYLTVPNNAAFNLSTNDFTLELFWYPTTFQAGSLIESSSTSSYAYAIYAQSSGAVQFYAGTGASASWNILSAVAMGTATLNAWNHIVVVRSGTTFSYYLNGVRTGQSTGVSAAIGQQTIAIGGNSVGASITGPGYISSARLVNGTAVYSGTTLTIPSAPLPAVTNTQLLLNFTNAGIYDGTMKNNVETVGNASVSTAVVKYGSGSMYFDGTGDYLLIPTNAGMALGASDFTVEMWVYVLNYPAAANFDSIWGCTTAANVATGFHYGIDSSGQLFIYQNSAFRISASSSSGTLPRNIWNHVAIVRSAGVVRFYVNGVVSTSTWSTTQNFSQGGGFIGAAPGGGSEYFEGYLDDLRVTTGIARYTSNFMPPSVALPRQ